MKKSVVLALLMLLTMSFAQLARPTVYVSEQRPTLIKLSELVPERFGAWRLYEVPSAIIVNPQQAEVIGRIYSDVLTRTYTDDQGRRIMLSVAYGKDQRSDMAIHYPEVCYPAQGFSIDDMREDYIGLDDRRIEVTRLNTRLGTNRREAVTYWATIGDYSASKGLERRFIELRYGLSGLIPDGLLFRVSSIEEDPLRAYRSHDEFIMELLKTVSASTKTILIGTRQDANK